MSRLTSNIANRQRNVARQLALNVETPLPYIPILSILLEHAEADRPRLNRSDEGIIERQHGRTGAEAAQLGSIVLPCIVSDYAPCRICHGIELLVAGERRVEIRSTYLHEVLWAC